MRILHSWLRQYVPFRLSPEVLEQRLTMLGLEFERIERLDEKYKGFVVGLVVDAARHPSADRLTVCNVSIGSDTIQIVCGAPNVAAGQKVVVGLPGAVVPKNQHDPAGAPLVLSVVSLRGVESRGMICSEYELDLGKQADEIIVLDDDARPGQRFTDYFGLKDVAYDIEITPNRPDWLSHFGVAREIGVLVGRPPTLPAVTLSEGKVPIRQYLRVDVRDPMDCPRFAARMIRGVRIGPSPRWLRNTLRNAGLRPRNNVVDITNYVMLECGHPLHAFDYSLLKGGTIVVRQAQAGAMFETLDGKRHTLPDGAVMVCDAEREVSIAGIMGGANSEINDATSDVVLEAAYWNPSSIRRTAKALGISTDASQRFERGADPNGVDYALARAAQLVTELAGGELLKGVVDVYPKKIRNRSITLRPDRLNSVLGTSLSLREITRILKLLGLTIASAKSGVLRCEAPTFRVDLEREIDLIEEVARVYGYDNIEEKTTATVNFARPGAITRKADAVRTQLVGEGFREVLTNSMQDQWRAEWGRVSPVRIINPLGQDMAYLRSSLVPGLVDVVARNQSFGVTDLRIFEIGHVFRVEKGNSQALVEDFVEEDRVCIVLCGNANVPHWSHVVRPVDIYDMKGVVEALLAGCGLDKWRLISYPTSDGLTDNSLAIEIEGSTAGYCGRLEPGSRQKFGCKQDVFVAELQLEALRVVGERKYVELPRFPKVKRDVAFFLGSDVHAGDVQSTIREACGELLQAVEVFDVYEGELDTGGKKSLAFSLELMSRDRTLTEAEIEAAVRHAINAVEQRFGGVVRSAK